MRNPLFLAALLAALPLSVLGGCGGGETSATAPVTTPLRLDISWSARSRDTPTPTPTPNPTNTITAPGSARSAVVTLQQGSFPATNRKDDLANYVESYVSPTKVRPGPNLLTVTFYAEKGGTGAVVATATKAINISDQGDTGAGSVLVLGKVQKVVVTRWC